MNVATAKRLFFLDAPGGTGKTFLINTIQAFLDTKLGKIIEVASSTVATIVLRDGKTAHLKFKIPIPKTSDSTCHISGNFRLGKEW